jgi:NAD(P)-dependent dehydrogenase (short-subunit alcohol dehydrogenase family)
LYLENISNGMSSVDILIYNARFPFGKKIWFKNIHDFSEVELMNNLQVDLIGSFRITKEILKLMMKKEVELSSILLQPLPYSDIIVVVRTL